MQISHQLVPKLKNLRLSGVLATLEVRTQQAIEEKLSYVEFLQRLLEDDLAHRRAREDLRRAVALVRLLRALCGLEDLLQAAEHPLQVVVVSDRLTHKSVI